MYIILWMYYPHTYNVISIVNREHATRSIPRRYLLIWPNWSCSTFPFHSWYVWNNRLLYCVSTNNILSRWQRQVTNDYPDLWRRHNAPLVNALFYDVFMIFFIKIIWIFWAVLNPPSLLILLFMVDSNEWSQRYVRCPTGSKGNKCTTSRVACNNCNSK